MPALVRGDGDAVRIFLQRTGDYLLDRTVVTEMDHLASGGLKDAAHNVDRRVMAIEQARGRDKAHLVQRLVDERLAGNGAIVHRRIPELHMARRRAESLLLGVALPTLYYVYVNVNIVARISGAFTIRQGPSVWAAIDPNFRRH